MKTEHSGAFDLAEAIRRRFAPFGGVDDLLSHHPVSVDEPPMFDARSTAVGWEIPSKASMR